MLVQKSQGRKSIPNCSEKLDISKLSYCEPVLLNNFQSVTYTNRGATSCMILTCIVGFSVEVFSKGEVDESQIVGSDIESSQIRG